MQGNVWYINGKLAANFLPAFHPNDANCNNWDEDHDQANRDAAKPIFEAIYGVSPDLRHEAGQNPIHVWEAGYHWISALQALGIDEDDYFHIAQADYLTYRVWERGDLKIEVFPYLIEKPYDIRYENRKKE